VIGGPDQGKWLPCKILGPGKGARTTTADIKSAGGLRGGAHIGHLDGAGPWFDVHVFPANVEAVSGRDVASVSIEHLRLPAEGGEWSLSGEWRVTTAVQADRRPSQSRYSLVHEKGTATFSGVQTHNGPEGDDLLEPPWKVEGRIVASEQGLIVKWKCEPSAREGKDAKAPAVFCEATLVMSDPRWHLVGASIT